MKSRIHLVLLASMTVIGCVNTVEDPPPACDGVGGSAGVGGSTSTVSSTGTDTSGTGGGSGGLVVFHWRCPFGSSEPTGDEIRESGGYGMRDLCLDDYHSDSTIEVLSFYKGIATRSLVKCEDLAVSSAYLVPFPGMWREGDSTALDDTAIDTTTPLDEGQRWCTTRALGPGGWGKYTTIGTSFSRLTFP